MLSLTLYFRCSGVLDWLIKFFSLQCPHKVFMFSFIYIFRSVSNASRRFPIVSDAFLVHVTSILLFICMTFIQFFSRTPKWKSLKHRTRVNSPRCSNSQDSPRPPLSVRGGGLGFICDSPWSSRNHLYSFNFFLTGHVAHPTLKWVVS